MESKIPFGFERSDIEEIIRQWEEFNYRINEEGEEFSADKDDYNDDWHIDIDPSDDYIDRYYCHYGLATFVISTTPEDNVTYISESVTLHFEDGNNEEYWIEELRQML